MTQLALFDERPPEPLRLPNDGDKARRGAWEIRNWRGWYQSREIVDGRAGAWCFQIYGFRDDDCSVYAFDPISGDVIRCDVPIDDRDRILVDGRRYGRDRWAH